MESIAIYFLWAALGLILVVVEMMTGTFVLLSFGVAAFAVALFSFLGVESKTLQVALFSILGLGALGFTRARGMKKPSAQTFQTDVHHSFVVGSDLPTPMMPGEQGTLSYQGSPWTAINSGSTPISAGQKVIITKTEGIKIYIKASL